MDATEHSLRRDNARLRDKLAEMGKQRDRSIEAHARAAKEAARLAALTDDQAKEIERLTGAAGRDVSALVCAADETFLVGLVMTLTGGSANPNVIRAHIARIKEPSNDRT